MARIILCLSLLCFSSYQRILGEVVFISVSNNFSPRGRIVRFNSFDSSLKLIHEETLGSPGQIAIDEDNGHLYWSLASGGATPSVRRANLDGTEALTLVGELGNSAGLALDSGNGHLYYTTRDNVLIEEQYWLVPIRRVDLDGTNSVDVVEASMALGIELDINGGKMYWGDDGSLEPDEFDGFPMVSTLRRANLDGSDVEVILEDEEVGGIALDLDSDKLYWANWRDDTVNRADLDGNNQELLFPLSNARCCDILDVVDEQLYWLDGSELRTADLDGTNMRTLTTVPGQRVSAIRVFSPPLMVGDINIDGLINDEDINLVAAAAKESTTNVDFDFDGSGVVNADDFQYMITKIVSTIPGDADLNREVEFADFLALSDGFGEPGGWAAGDFNGNGNVEFGDFLLLADNFGKSANSVAVVPEPVGSTMAAFTLLWVISSLRRRRAK